VVDREIAISARRIQVAVKDGVQAGAPPGAAMSGEWPAADDGCNGCSFATDLEAVQRASNQAGTQTVIRTAPAGWKLSRLTD